MKSAKLFGRAVARNWKTIIGILAFAFLMGIRDEFSQLWIRVLLAGVAGGIYGVTLWQRRHPPRK